MKIGANIQRRTIFIEERPAPGLAAVRTVYQVEVMPAHDPDLVSIGWDDEAAHVIEERRLKSAPIPGEGGETEALDVHEVVIPKYIQQGHGMTVRQRADGDFAEVFLDRALIAPFEAAWRDAHAKEAARRVRMQVSATTARLVPDGYTAP